MRAALYRLKPKTIKHKLFAAFVLLIFVPLLLLQLSMYDNTEKLISHRVSEQNSLQMGQVRQNFEIMRSFMLTSVVTLELMLRQQEVFGAGNAIEASERGRIVSESLRRLKEQNELNSAQLSFTVLDLAGHAYMDGEGPADYAALRQEGGFRAIENGQVKYVWISGASAQNAVPSELSLYALLESEGSAFAMVHVAFRFEDWLRSIAKAFAVYQDYYILDEKGETLASTRSRGLDAAIYRDVVLTGEWKNGVHQNAVVSVGTLPSLGWTIVSSFPMEIYFGDLHQQQIRYLLTFIGIMLAFVAITFYVLRRITRPLHLLERRMSETVEQRFVKGINEKPYEGEILSLSRTFNRMLRDMQDLVAKIKRDEKQKEALRYQSLIAVMNPHFLLNTLNTVKWLAMRKNEREIASICVQLGLLLETSLNTDVELIRVSEELELIRAYVAIQQNRHLHPFSVRYEVGPELEHALLPKMTLQPLVENAIIHGFAGTEKEGAIDICILAQDGRLVIEVADDGIGLAASAQVKRIRKRNSIGLANLRERLALLFKSDASLETDSDDAGTRVRIVIPLLVAKPYDSAYS
ncbi:sensor histidine kinase [Cohnella sp. GCM10012308]|uniref:sensor histidine kinase n=1 Tax=Cohnella sp. GCM10012308 TaxID=3317329 RepID=UPI0036194FFB